MADSTYVFDPEVFAFMFDITDVSPSIRSVSVPRQYRNAKEGQSIPITVYIENNVTTPGRSFLMSLDIPPAITIYNPADTAVISSVLMEEVEQGTYTYVYETSPSNVSGDYSAVFTAANNTKQLVSSRYHLFILT